MNPGAGALEFGLVGQRTVVTRAYARSPLRLLNPRNHGPSAWVYTSTYGGGLVGGDTIDLRVSVGAGATALLATQASTKVYRSPPRRPCHQRLAAQVDGDGLLVLAPDPVVCFAGSRFAQQQTIHLSATASLWLIDWLSAGRLASGERWDFDSYSSRIEIWQDGQQLVHEAVRLSSEPGSLTERLGRMNALAVVVVVGHKLRSAAARLLAALKPTTAERQPQLLIVGSPLGSGGALLRLGGASLEQVGGALREFCQFLLPLLQDDPWSRRW